MSSPLTLDPERAIREIEETITEALTIARRALED